MKEQLLDPTDKEIVSRMRRVAAFDNLSQHQLDEVIKVSRLRKYEPGEELIIEGDYDQHVFFLITGNLAIRRKGKELGHIRRLGDVFGEMGIIDGSPRSATICATEPTLCLAVDLAFIDRLNGADKTMAEAVFYRVFAKILSARLREANRRIGELTR